MGFRDAIEGRGLRAGATWHELDDRWYSSAPDGGATWAGMPVSTATAMEVSTVMGCVSLIADTIARVPPILYRRQRDGGKARAYEHPLYARLAHVPNSRQTRFRFFRYMARQLALRGNAYAEITPRLELLPKFPDLVTVEELDSGRARYQVRDKTGRQRAVLQDAMLHLVDDGDDPTVGTSRARLARQAIAVSAAAEQYTARFFKNDATGRLLLTKKGQVPDESKRADYRSMIQENYAGAGNASRAMILYGDVEATELGKATDSGFIVMPRKHQATEICRYWRVQPFMIGLDDKTTWGTNIEQIKRAFVDFTALPWGDNIQQELERSLLDDNEREDYVIEFLYDDLLRGDTLQRMQAYQIARLIGVLNPNEIRAMENRNPRPGGDQYQETPVGGAPNAPARRATDPRREDVDEEETDANAIPAPLLADYAGRIVGEEIREVGKRADKASADPERFSAWVTTFAGEHRARAGKVLESLATWHKYDAALIGDVTARIERTFVAALSDGVPEGWAAQRQREVEAIIEESFRAAAALKEAA